MLVQTGDHICQINPEVYGSLSTDGGAELSSNCHPQGNDSG